MYQIANSNNITHIISGENETEVKADNPLVISKMLLRIYIPT